MVCNRRLARSLAAAGLGVCLLWGAASAQTREATPGGAPAIAIENFGRVTELYYRGAQPSDRDYRALAAFGIRTVIDLQADGLSSEPARVAAAGMQFYRIPMTTHVPPTPAQLALFLSLVNDPANQPVYVHCAGGRHRTGVMTAIHRIADLRWSADQAFREMKEYKFGPDFLHPEFKRFVYTYRP